MGQSAQITAIVLAGGKSSRMGVDKGTMLLNGKTMIEHVLEAVKPIANNIILIANDNKYNTFGYPVFKDVYVDCGPIAGIYTGLMNSTTEKNVVLSCDIPFLNTKLVEKLIAYEKDYDALITRINQKTEPLIGIYNKRCSKFLLESIKKKEYKIQEALAHLETEFLDLNEFLNASININTLTDFNKYNTK